jgi:putative ABC transport system permease protein
MTSAAPRGSLARLAMKLLWRDWRSGELNILTAALLVAVTTVTGIGLFTDRISNSILDEAGSLLAADAQIRGSQPLPEIWLEQAIAAGLETAQVTTFQAMVFGPGRSAELASVKAVSQAYPLKGELEVSTEPYGLIEKTQVGPQPSEAWVNSRLLAALGMKVGDTIGVGDGDFTIAKVVIAEPDNAGGDFGLNPRVMINAADIGQTGAVQLGSRVGYRLLLAGDVEPYRLEWLKQKGEHHRWRSVSDANERITATLERAESFLLLAGSLGVILGGVALALASKRYATRQLSHVALLKTVGVTPNGIALLYAGSLVVLGLVAVLVGLFLGWVLHWAFLELFSGLLPRELVAATSQPLWIGFITGLVCLLAFAFPPVWVLRLTPPARVFNSNVAGGTINTARTTTIGVVAVIGLVYFYSNSLLITGALMAAGAVAIIGVTLLAGLMIRLARASGSRLGTTWRLGLASLQRNGSQNSFQIMIFAMALMLLFILTLLRTSLLTEWQQQLPEGTPNHFAFNIFEQEKTGLEALLAERKIPATPFYPMMRGRLVKVDGEPIQDRLARLEPEGDDFRRELNVTWSSVLADDNEVVEGDWFDAADADQPYVSIEADFAKALAVSVGDTVEFSFGGQSVESVVDNIRTVQWDSLAPNFYVIFSGPILSGSGAAYLTSFFLTPEQKPLLTDILAAYPTISLIEVDAILKRIQSIVGQVTLAIEFILGLVLVAGLIVLIASVQATLDSRLQESAILRTLGARARLVRGALAIEFFTLGGVAGLLAALGSEIALYFLQTELLNMAFSVNWPIFILGPVVGASLIGLVGLLSTRKVVRVPPLMVLRQL